MSRTSSDPIRQASGEHAGLASLRGSERHAIEDVLRALLECEFRNQPASEAQLADYVGVEGRIVLGTLQTAQRLGLVDPEAGRWRLTSTGNPVAVRVMRAHRLIETRLARESSVPPPRWHQVAHSSEHSLTNDEVNRLADALDNPRFDPHGDPIPTREGGLPEPEGEPLLSWRSTGPAVITHIEDEPPKLFARLAKRGVIAGDRMRLIASTPAGVRLDIEGKEMLLPVDLAGLVRVRELRDAERPVPAGARRLADIPTGGEATVVRLLPGCAGQERSRLLDLGFVPGSRIVHQFDSPFHGPAAYHVRGTMVALRKEQADQVLVVPSKPAS